MPDLNYKKLQKLPVFTIGDPIIGGVGPCNPQANGWTMDPEELRKALRPSTQKTWKHQFSPSGCWTKNRGILPPKWMVYFMVPNPMNKWMIWGVFPYFWFNTHLLHLKKTQRAGKIIRFQDFTSKMPMATSHVSCKFMPTPHPTPPLLPPFLWGWSLLSPHNSLSQWTLK